jgi:signal transduction histidine kinase/CheY-like chemotaxis protein
MARAASGGPHIRIVKIHALLLVGRTWLALAVLALGGCSLAPGPDIQRLTEGRAADGERVELPRSWTRESFDPGARIDVPFVLSGTPRTMGIYLGATTVAFRASVNGAFVFESNDALSPSINYGSYRAAPFFRIPADLLRTGENVLTFEVSAPADTYPLELGTVYVGGSAAAERAYFRRWLAFHVGPMAISVVLLAVGLVSLGLWRGRRDSELFLLLAIGSLLWALQIVMIQSPTRWFPRPHWSVFVTAIYAWFPALIGVFFVRFAYRRSKPIEAGAVALAVCAAPLLYAGFHFGVPDLASIVLRFGVLVFIAIALVALLRYALELRTWTGYTLFAMGSICVVVAVRDFILSVLPDSDETLVLNPYSGVALVLFAGWMLLERYHKAYADFEMLNRDLEQRVDAANIELHRRLELVEAARATAEQANVAKSRFFAAASHDLRQPLHSLGLFATALRDVADPAEGRALVRRIGESIGALNRLFDELLDISRLEAGTVEVRRRDLALQPLFDRLNDEFHAEAASKGLRLRFHPTALAVNADPTLLERILANLVSNAIRYTPEGGVLIGARRRLGQVRLQVWDTGVGIAPEQRSMIFEEFYQIENTARDPRKGLGLGLSIVRRLSMLLGIPLDFTSVPGRGTCFVLTLPAAAGPAQPPVIDEVDELERRFEGSRALIIDDDPAICEATEQLLQRWGFEARAVGGVAAACDMVGAGFVPDVIVADLRLAGDADGMRAVELLRERAGRPLPALLVSGDTGARELARVKQSGLMLLTKPVAPARLRSVLHALLARGAVTPVD